MSDQVTIVAVAPSRHRRARRPTFYVVVVGLLLAGRPHDEHWACDIAERAELWPGTAWQVLRRMRDAGWLADRMEPKPPGQPGNARRLYRVTADGILALRDIYQFAEGKALYRPWMPDDAPELPDNATPRDHMIHDDPLWRAEKPPRPATPHSPTPPRERGTCQECQTEHQLREDGTMPGHGGARPGHRCDGSWMYPLLDATTSLRR